MSRYPTTVHALVAHCGANVDIQTCPARFSPLHWSARHNFPDVAATLLALGAQIDIPAADGSTPLITAAWNAHTEMVNLLAHHGADLNAVTHSGWTALTAATHSGNPHVLEAITRLIARRRLPPPR